MKISDAELSLNRVFAQAVHLTDEQWAQAASERRPLMIGKIQAHVETPTQFIYTRDGWIKVPKEWIGKRVALMPIED